VWVYDLGSQDVSGTLAEQLAPSSGERLSLKKSVANPKEILEPEDFTFQISTSRELAVKCFVVGTNVHCSV
jgi:hypothetical protein